MRPPTPLGTHGSVSIRKIGGKWVTRTRYRDYDGKLRLVEASATTKTSAQQALAQKIRDRARPTTGITNTATIKQLVSIWWEETKARDLSPRTLDRYEEVARRIIEPKIGDLRLHEVTPALLANTIKAIASRHGEGNAHQARTIIGQLFTVAVQHGAIEVNPAHDLPRPKRSKKTVKALTVREAQGIQEYLTGDILAVYKVMLGTGARISEVLALKWENIDFTNRRLYISGAVKRTRAEGLFIGEPKSEHSDHWLYVPDFVLSVLAGRPRTSHLVFPTSTGGILEPTNYRKQWRKQLKNTPYAGTHPHMLRATVATELARLLDSKAASKQLGHSSEKVTEAYYLAVDNVAPDLSEALQKLFESDGKVMD